MGTQAMTVYEGCAVEPDGTPSDNDLRDMYALPLVRGKHRVRSHRLCGDTVRPNFRAGYGPNVMVCDTCCFPRPANPPTTGAWSWLEFEEVCP